MPNEVFGLFDSNDGDRKYSADDFVGFFADFFTNGIVADSTTYLQVKADSGMTLSVNSGKAYINGGFFKPQTPTTLTLPDSDTTYPRYDLIVLRWDKVLRSIYLDVVSGVGAEVPTVPALTRNEITYELGLASIYIAANATEITQANITDLRFNNNYCGVVTGVIDTIDTTALFAQYEQAWYDFVAQLGESDNVTINTALYKIRRGSVTTDANGFSGSIRFDDAFSETPTVIVSAKYVSTTQSLAKTYTAHVVNLNNSLFQVRTYEVTSGAVKGVPLAFEWIAIGT